MGQAQINVRTRACSRTFIARTKQAALTHHVRGKELRRIQIYCRLWPMVLQNGTTRLEVETGSVRFCRAYTDEPLPVQHLIREVDSSEYHLRQNNILLVSGCFSKTGSSILIGCNHILNYRCMHYMSTSIYKVKMVTS